MKKIGLVTYYNSDNYGAMLQAYGLQAEILKNGCECQIVSHNRFSTSVTDYSTQGKGISAKAKKMFRLCTLFPKSVQMMLNLRSKEVRYGIERGKAKCARFREEAFPNRTSVFYYTTDQIMKDPPVCDAYICGSDQIWNPERFEGAEPFFLSFAPAGRNRIAYAPSLAMDYIPEALKSKYAKLISSFSDVSVREKKGCLAIENTTGIHAELVMDPAFLMDKKEWDAFSDVSLDLPEKYLLCYFLSKENLLYARKTINSLANSLNVKIIVLPYGLHTVDKKWIGLDNIGPKEFVHLISHATYVLTDSFHGTALSIIQQKNFNVYYGTKNKSFSNRFDRIDNLLEICGLRERVFENNKHLISSNVDYTVVEKKLSPMIVKSHEYLKAALEKVSEKPEIKKTIPNLASYESCTGCSACYAACSVHAISMLPDKAGFWRPTISSEKCIHCGKCSRFCPIIHPNDNSNQNKEYFALYAKDTRFRDKGSSGNAFGLFAHEIIVEDGEVFGAALSENCRELFISSAKEVGFECLQKSKYFEAQMGGAILRINSLLEAGMQVMFTGTPCQADGIRKYFGNNPNLLVCDFICHGVTSAKWFGMYLDQIEEKYRAKVQSVSFRSKALGWRLYCMKIIFDNKKQYLKTRYSDPYYIDFFKNKHLRTNCYSCNRGMASSADVTFGDYWAVNVKKNMDDTDEGISFVCLRTTKGKDFFYKHIYDSKDIVIKHLSEEEVDLTMTSKVRKPAKGHDDLPNQFIMHPRLNKREKLQAIYYDGFIKRIKKKQTSNRQKT